MDGQTGHADRHTRTFSIFVALGREGSVSRGAARWVPLCSHEDGWADDPLPCMVCWFFLGCPGTRASPPQTSGGAAGLNPGLKDNGGSLTQLCHLPKVTMEPNAGVAVEGALMGAEEIEGPQGIDFMASQSRRCTTLGARGSGKGRVTGVPNSRRTSSWRWGMTNVPQKAEA
jgi:hypothetical protein